MAEHPDFPDDRKSWLGLSAAEEAWKFAGFPKFKRESSAVFLGTGLSSITAREIEEDLYPHLRSNAFDRREMALDLNPNKGAPRRHLPHRLCSWIGDEYGIGSRGTSFSACAASRRLSLRASEP